ncbi:MAG: pyridoxamine kinase [Oscillospiraceae bacterium]|nr:pyridoxamine kinase [Oscillospiraceae bacterium]
MKRIVSIQDFSCIGKCSQSIALPVLSAMGLECAALPTVLLSAHTAFDGFYSRELTDSIEPITGHWKRLGVRFDTVYTGYLGSEAQVALVEQVIADFAAALVFVDPVMADHGKLYPGFAPDFPARMKELCRRADVITPNVTEACLLTGENYCERHGEGFVRALLEKLLLLGAKTAIVTGIRMDENHMGVAAMDAAGRFSLHNTEFIPSVFYGTGDLFASTCAGALTLGMPAPAAIALAADYVVKTIRVTAQDSDARWYGVNFEQTLPYLMARLGMVEENMK